MMWFQIILLSFYFSVLDSSLASTHLLVTRVGSCHDLHDPVVKVSEISVTTLNYESTLSGIINISENIGDGWNIHATMQKCVDIRNIDSCDSFKSFVVVKNGCSSHEDKHLYKLFLNYTNPKIKCPVTAGRYEILHYPFYSKDNPMIVYGSKISTSVFGYTFRLNGFTLDERQMLCVEAYLQLLYKRKHRWDDNNTRVSVTTVYPFANDEEKKDSQE